ncbi:MAG: YfhO family protein [Bacteroidota bacterium]|jgi:hypothetical protein
MKKAIWQNVAPHLLAIAIFLVVALIYCKPVLEGKVLQQMDVTQWKGMAQNSFVYKQKHGEFPLWTNGIFSGMPAFQITSVGSNPVSVGYLHQVFTLFLPKPVSLFFLACLCFYFLTQVMGARLVIGIAGALSYAYATYNPIIVGVGHDTKMQAIAYLPAFIAALWVLYEKRSYLIGTALIAVFTALLVASNHLQITYYALILALIMSIGFGINWIRQKDFSHLSRAAGLVVVGALLGVMVNAVTLFTTYSYSKATIRGGSELAEKKGQVTKTGLSKDYALSYSIFPSESLVMMFPNLYGGSSDNRQVPEESSKAFEALQQMPQQLAQQLASFPYYWGGINEGTSGPPYAGAIICFLALLGFFLIDKQHRGWLLAAILLTTAMSWGKYFEGFTGALLDYLPFYNKFRAPSMILVIPTLLLCMMAVMALNALTTHTDKKWLMQQWKKGMLLTAVVFFAALLIYFTGDFSSESSDGFLLKQVSSIKEAEQREQIEAPVKSFVNALREDRKDLFMGSLLRSLAFIVIAAALCWLIIKDKLKSAIAVGVMGFFAFVDVMMIDVKYFNAENFQDSDEYNSVFEPTPIDQEILKDTGYYRVLDLSPGLSGAFNSGAISAYFHRSIGGYHPAKLSIYQDLIEKQLYNYPDCRPVLNMLNARYIILPPMQQGETVSLRRNDEALGAAWFVQQVSPKKTAADVMTALTYLHPKDTALVLEKDMAALSSLTGNMDSTASIQLIYNDNDRIAYSSRSAANGFAVFSEIYYADGWVATIDGKETPIIRTNYVLRGLPIPAGEHRIEFQFKPASFYNSSRAGLVSSVLIWVLLFMAAFQAFKKNRPGAAA